MTIKSGQPKWLYRGRVIDDGQGEEAFYVVLPAALRRAANKAVAKSRADRKAATIARTRAKRLR